MAEQCSQALLSNMEGLELPDLENLLDGIDEEQDPEWFNSLLDNALDVDLDFSVPLEDLLSSPLSFSDQTQTLSNGQSSDESVIANAESHEICYQISSPASSSGDSTARKNLKRKSDDEGDLQNGVSKNPSSPSSFMDDDEKRKARLMRNRESAQLSRQRRKNYMDELEEKVKSMNSTIVELNNTIACLSSENIKLKQQLGMGALYQNPNPNPNQAMPFPYPWQPYPAYPVMAGARVYGPGSQAPLVPIPRLKSQPSVVSKGRKPSKQSAEADQKPAKRVKKVASVAFVGLFFFMFFFLGGILPVPDMTMKQSREFFMTTSGELSSKGGGRVLTSWGGNNSTLGGEFKPGFDQGKGGCEDYIDKEAIRNQVYPQNGSVPLVASLFVPRNDKLVKIDGNLIIHAVLAGDKASKGNRDGREEISSMKKESEKNSLAIITERHRARAAARASGGNGNIQSHLFDGVGDSQRALASNSRSNYRENGKSTSADRSLQQWFREGLAGPVLSSGMCTEVFQFDSSGNPPATTRSSKIVTTVSPRVANSSVRQLKNNSSQSKITEARKLGSLNVLRNRRVSYAVPLPPARPQLKDRNFTDRTERIHEDRGYKGENTTSSSMVVSVLVDPRDEGMFSSGSLSRIFVVVLIDRVKYVTYSCVLPTSSSVPHLVRS